MMSFTMSLKNGLIDCNFYFVFQYELFFIYRSLILLFVAILLFSTIYEAYCLRSGNNKSSVAHDLVISFSVMNNLKKILSTRQNNSLGLECVTGIKTLAMVFIIAGHACLFIGSGPVMDADAWDRVSFVDTLICFFFIF